MKKKNIKKIKRFIISIISIFILALIGYSTPNIQKDIKNSLGLETATRAVTSFDLNSIPEYENSPYIYKSDRSHVVL